MGLAVHPALRLLSAFLVILLVSLSRSLSFLFLIGTLELVVTSSLNGRRIATVLKTGFTAAAFAFVIFLPSALWGNWPGVVTVALKVLLSVIAAALVTATAGWPSITRGLSALRLPDTFILVLDLTIKYISLLGGLVLDMLYALRLRSVGRNRNKTASLSGVAGTTFLKSKEAVDDLYAAMECRGFAGTYRGGPRARLSPWDFAFIAANLAIAGAFLYLQGA